eukprot:7097242-Alexandrium_andersonii.AAC.1
MRCPCIFLLVSRAQPLRARACECRSGRLNRFRRPRACGGGYRTDGSWAERAPGEVAGPRELMMPPALGV